MDVIVNLTISGDQVSYYGNTYTCHGYEKIDDICVHLNLDNGWVCFLGGETIINGVLKNTADEIIAEL
jgi:hypothetical protein